jgi:L,D-peptidoglycan transpeptidase YkuD (ErfK/YbiS/YcfS/YnhG family)
VFPGGRAGLRGSLIVCAGVAAAATLPMPSAVASPAAPSAAPSPAASAASAAANAAANAANDPCRALNQRRSRYKVGVARHVLFAVADRYGATQVSITECARKSKGARWRTVLTSKGYTGRNGFAKPGTKREGDGKAPTGSYTLTEAFGERNPGTRLRYRTLRATGDCWGSTIGDPRYNRYYAGKCGPADEDLSATMASGPYKQAVVINYNRPPDSRIVQGNGSAIFLHVSMNRPTAGCISLPRPKLEAAMRSFRPFDRIIMGTRQALFR